MNFINRQTRTHSAFTLIELLVVISIIAMLIAILLPSLNKARNMAYAVSCMSQQRQIGQVINIYQSDNHGYNPPVNRDGDSRVWTYAYDENYSWAQDPSMWAAYYLRTKYPPDLGINGVRFKSVLICPAAPPLPRYSGASNYGYSIEIGGAGAGSLVPYYPRRKEQDIKKPSKVYTLADLKDPFPSSSQDARNYVISEYYSRDLVRDNLSYRHNDAINVLYFDGHVTMEKPYLSKSLENWARY